MGQVKKKINVQDLEIGMRIADLDRPWLETPMLFQGDVIHTQSEIDELRRYCNYVYITVSQSGKVVARAAGEVAQRDTAAQDTVEPQRLEFDLLKKAATPQYGEHRYPDQTTLEQEIKTVRRIHDEEPVGRIIALANFTKRRDFHSDIFLANTEKSTDSQDDCLNVT